MVRPHYGRYPRRVDRSTTGVVSPHRVEGVPFVCGAGLEGARGRSQSTITRREILKRGAIVGGGVLFTSVVQTLGMSAAVAADVSGDRSCSVMLKFVECPFRRSLGSESRVRSSRSFPLCLQPPRRWSRRRTAHRWHQSKVEHDGC